MTRMTETDIFLNEFFYSKNSLLFLENLFSRLKNRLIARENESPSLGCSSGVFKGRFTWNEPLVKVLVVSENIFSESSSSENLFLRNFFNRSKFLH